MNVVAAPPAGLLVNRTHMPHTLDAGLGARARIGIIELATDQTSEHEFRRLLAVPGVDFYESRVRNSPNITPETLAELEGEVEAGTAVILPDLRLDAIGFTCTSGAMVIGEDKLFGLIRKVRPGIPCTSPITGAMAAMRALGLGRVALLTPYVQSINDMMRGYIEARGVAVPAMGSFNNPDDDQVARIAAASTRDAAIELARSPHVDGVFVSCTSLRTIDIVEEVEAATGKPMVSSNQAQAWHMLRLAGVDDRLQGFGRLFRL